MFKTRSVDQRNMLTRMFLINIHLAESTMAPAYMFKNTHMALPVVSFPRPVPEILVTWIILDHLGSWMDPGNPGN